MNNIFLKCYVKVAAEHIIHEYDWYSLSLAFFVVFVCVLDEFLVTNRTLVGSLFGNRSHQYLPHP